MVSAARNCKFAFNGNDNLITLEKFVKETNTGRHGSHPQYNDWISILLDQKLLDYQQKNNGLSPDSCKAKELLFELIDEFRTIINSSNKKINQIGAEQLKLLGK